MPPLVGPSGFSIRSGVAENVRRSVLLKGRIGRWKRRPDAQSVALV